ncbi:MAG: hypothetical protein J3K34DRAFT_396852 [Monoraphidium minutum]|nr:MAG: hypothetical protein J3K34DRAFT_396852 [Monoraphidium minutum]
MATAGPRRLQYVRLLLAMAAAAALVGMASAGRAPTEISDNAIVTSLYDVEHAGPDGATSCEAIVRKAREAGQSSRIGVVLTIAARGSEKVLGSYSYQDGYGSRVPASQDSINRFRNGLERCFRAAVDAGFTLIRVLPHVDIFEVDASGRQKGTLWRNVVRFDPLAKYDGFSYEDVLLNPGMEAFKAVAKTDTSVEFSLAGEQGLSVFAFPKKWQAAMGRMRGELAGAGSGRHAFGVCFNWDKVCGCVEPRERNPVVYNRTYAQRLDRWRKDETKDKLMGPSVVDVAGTKALLEASDFVGVSGYAPIVRPLSLDAISWETEHGLGGCYWDFSVAPDLEFVKIHPWVGIWPSPAYEPGGDPWMKPDYKKFRREFYSYMVEWAKRGGGPQYQVDGIYTWSVGSFDFNGVHPATSSGSGTYADPEISRSVRDANQLVQSGAFKAPPPATNAPRPSPAPAQAPAAVPVLLLVGAAPRAAYKGPDPTTKDDVLKASVGGVIMSGGAAERATKLTPFATATARPTHQALDGLGLKAFSRLAAAADLRESLGGAARSKGALLPRLTVLAPTDALGMEPSEVSKNAILATRITNHHAIPGEPIPSASLTDGRVLTPARGGTLTTELRQSAKSGAANNAKPDIVIQGMQNEASIVTRDVALGPDIVVHVVDAVLLPDDVFKTIKDALELATAFRPAAELAEAGFGGAMGPLLRDPSAALTLFVPSAKALDAAGITADADMGQLAAFLSYHALPAPRVAPNEFSDGDVLPTMLEGHSVTVQKRPGKGGNQPVLTLFSEDPLALPVRVTGRFNVIAGRSYLNLVDGVLFPEGL